MSYLDLRRVLAQAKCYYVVGYSYIESVLGEGINCINSYFIVMISYLLWVVNVDHFVHYINQFFHMVQVFYKFRYVFHRKDSMAAED